MIKPQFSLRAILITTAVIAVGLNRIEVRTAWPGGPLKEVTVNGPFGYWASIDSYVSVGYYDGEGVVWWVNWYFVACRDLTIIKGGQLNGRFLRYRQPDSSVQPVDKFP
jgi:hypothetical protein